MPETNLTNPNSLQPPNGALTPNSQETVSAEPQAPKKKSLMRHIILWAIAICVGAALVYFVDYQAILDIFTGFRSEACFSVI